jgi:ribosomal protein S18 acetylase RimI-like enzyme
MTSKPVDVWRATMADLDLMVPLFDQYREFYGLKSNEDVCRTFLRERITKDESVVFLAGIRGTSGAGFTQLYLSFSSLLAARIWILYDLFVAPEARQRGVGRLLMNRAREHATETGAVSIILSTAKTNRSAQSLYESLGYVQDQEFLNYELVLPKP